VQASGHQHGWNFRVFTLIAGQLPCLGAWRQQRSGGRGVSGRLRIGAPGNHAACCEAATSRVSRAKKNTPAARSTAGGSLRSAILEQTRGACPSYPSEPPRGRTRGAARTKERPCASDLSKRWAERQRRRSRESARGRTNSGPASPGRSRNTASRGWNEGQNPASPGYGTRKSIGLRRPLCKERVATTRIRMERGSARTECAEYAGLGISEPPVFGEPEVLGAFWG